MIQADQPKLFDRKKVITGISSREDGNMKISDHEKAAQTIKNRRRFLTKLNIAVEQTAYMFVGDPHAWDVIHRVETQELGAGIIDQNRAIVADVLVTNQPGQALFLPVADCNPVIIHDPITQTLALLHLGWQSSAANLASKTVAYLQQNYGTNPADLLVHFGPAIKPQSYIFNTPVAQASDPSWAPFLIKAGTALGIDLPGYNHQKLLDCGVLARHMSISPIDTATSESYFSNYRANRLGKNYEGRFATACMLL